MQADFEFTFPKQANNSFQKLQIHSVYDIKTWLMLSLKNVAVGGLLRAAGVFSFFFFFSFYVFGLC